MSLIRDNYTIVVGKNEVLATVLDKDDHSIMSITFPEEGLKNKSIDEISSMIKNSDELSNLKGAASLMFIDSPYNELGEIPVRNLSSEYLAVFYLDVSYMLEGSTSTIIDANVISTSIRKLSSPDSKGLEESIGLIINEIVDSSKVNPKYIVGLSDKDGYYHKYKAIYTTISSDADYGKVSAKVTKLDTSDWKSYHDSTYYVLNIDDQSQAKSCVVSDSGELTSWMLRGSYINDDKLFYKGVICNHLLSSIDDYSGDIIELTNLDEKISNEILKDKLLGVYQSLDQDD